MQVYFWGKNMFIWEIFPNNTNFCYLINIKQVLWDEIKFITEREASELLGMLFYQLSGRRKDL